MKIIFLFTIYLFFFETTSNAQGLKGVELGDSGLNFPLMGMSTINTTIFDVEGDLVVKKFDGKIYAILFKTNYFSQGNADKLAMNLKDKYSIKSLQRNIDGTWNTAYGEKIYVSIDRDTFFDNRRKPWYVVLMYDSEIELKAQQSEDKKIYNNF